MLLFLVSVSTPNSGIPMWAFGLAITVITTLLAFLMWFVKREFSRYEKEFDKLKNVIYGYVEDNGTKILGILEKTNSCQEEKHNQEERLLEWEKKQETIIQEWEKNMSEVVENLKDIKSEQSKQARRIEASEKWKAEDSAKNREAMKKIEEKTDESSKMISEIKGKIDVLLKLTNRD